jgi:hypothetical protein
MPDYERCDGMTEDSYKIFETLPGNERTLEIVNKVIYTMVYVPREELLIKRYHNIIKFADEIIEFVSSRDESELKQELEDINASICQPTQNLTKPDRAVLVIQIVALNFLLDIYSYIDYIGRLLKKTFDELGE